MLIECEVEVSEGKKGEERWRCVKEAGVGGGEGCAGC